MQVITEKERQDAIEYMVELVYDWCDPIPIDLTGAGIELYRLLKDDFCMVLPDLTNEQLNNLDETMIDKLQYPEMNPKWAVDCLFTLMEDEGLIEIVKW